MEDVKVNLKAGSLALVAKSDVVKDKKSKIVDSDFDAIDDEFTSKEKALKVSNPKKVLQKKTLQSSEATTCQD